MIKNKSEIIFIDTEIAYMKFVDFSLKNYGYISPDNILQDWNIYCMAWKFLDSSRIYSACVDIKDPTNDKEICKEFREVLQDTKLVIGHNLDKFDIKKFNTRLIYHSLPPIDHKILTLDTYKVAKKHFNFSSNKLDYLAKFLGIGSKMKHPGNPWYSLITNPTQEVLDHMVKYCKYDVSPLLEGVYLKMRPYIDHPDLTEREKDEAWICTHCSSQDTQKRGFRMAKMGRKYQRFACMDCGGWGSELLKRVKNDK